jgi:D-3-phosphoglycerate dehydrogenase
MNTEKKVLITAPAHPILLEELQSRGCQVVYQTDISYEALKESIATVTGLVVTTRLKIDSAILDAAQELQWIGRLGSGMELIDVEYALAKGISCVSTPEGNSNAVGEHALALLLNLMNKVTKSFEEIKGGRWLRHENRGTELSGKTVGIIGFGHTGPAFARLLQPFGGKVLVYDKYKSGFNNDFITQTDLTTIQEQSDVVSVHVPLTAETHHMMNDDFFNGLKRQPYFITTCRGAVTDTAAAIRAIEAKKIAAAAFDVLENEKIATLNEQEKKQLRFLESQPNVLITPHIAGYSYEAYKNMSVLLIEKLASIQLIDSDRRR